MIFDFVFAIPNYCYSSIQFSLFVAIVCKINYEDLCLRLFIEIR